jgi:hypothetical protein
MMRWGKARACSSWKIAWSALTSKLDSRSPAQWPRRRSSGPLAAEHMQEVAATSRPAPRLGVANAGAGTRWRHPLARRALQAERWMDPGSGRHRQTASGTPGAGALAGAARASGGT